MTASEAGIEPGMAPDLSGPRAIHLIGIGGTGMRAIATVLAEQGHRVSGSDAADSEVLDRLRSLGVDAWAGHQPQRMADVDYVAHSTAVPETDAERVAATEAGVPVLCRADLLAAMTRLRPTIAIAGTHGKTTTSSLLAHTLRHADLDPSFVIGAELADIGTGARWGSGEWFVVEADESDSTFLALDRAWSVVTNIEADHLSHHGTFEALVAAFDRFAAGTSHGVVVCVDDEHSAALATRIDAITYGTSPHATYRVHGVEPNARGVRFLIDAPNHPSTLVDLPMPGDHNVANAAAAFAVAMEIGVDREVAAAGLSSFAGVARRFEHRGEANGITYVDDYAHLPTEVAAAIEAAQSGPWDRVVATFQPHRFTRTRDLWQDFTDAFVGVDQLVLCGIYTAGEAPIDGVTGSLLADAVSGAHPEQPLTYVETLDEVEAHLAAELRPGDLCLTLGAGDLTTMADRLLARTDPPGSVPSVELRAGEGRGPSAGSRSGSTNLIR